MKVFLAVVFCSVVALSAAAPSLLDNQINTEESLFDVTTKMIANCADSGDKMTCLVLKGVNTINRAARAQNIELLPGVNFVRDSNVAVSRDAKSLSENDIVGENRQEKNEKLFDATLDAASNFLSSHSLEFKIPKEATAGFARAIEEGRGKNKNMMKMIGPIILAVGAKLIALIPLFLGGLVLLATKALVVAKIAFFMAAALTVHKLIGGGAGLNLLSKVAGGGAAAPQAWSGNGGNVGWSTGGATQGWSSGGASSQYPYARSYDAQDMAYNGQIPANAQ